LWAAQPAGTRADRHARESLTMSQDAPLDGPLVLTGALTLQSMETVHARLMGLADREHLAIDCSDGTEVDVSLVQLILAARNSARQAGRTVTLTQPAAGALLDTLERGGFLNPCAEKSDAERMFWLEAGS
jgi:ABC-type transporter Mla MlaB component